MISTLLLLGLGLLPEPRVIVAAELSLYRPGIDGELSGATPYADLFGSGRDPLVGGRAGVAWPVIEDLTLTLTLGLSHYGNSAQAFVDDGGPGQRASGTQLSGGETTLDLTPVVLRAGARWTTLLTRLRVPLVPYVEGGVAYVPWEIGRGDGSTAASGTTTGLVVSAGLMIELMGIEKRASRAIRQDVGVTSVLLQAGVTRAWLDGFGASDALVLSDTAWTFGLELGF